MCRLKFAGSDGECTGMPSRYGDYLHPAGEQ